MLVPLVGRDAEIAEVLHRLEGRRLVTIVGPGGVGKTSLALAAASRAADNFENGAVVVDLTRVDVAVGVFEALAGQLGYADFASLMNSPSEAPALVVVDNCEHVLDAAADGIERILTACAMPTILATSRSPLDLPDESIVALGPLPVPAPQLPDVDNPSLALFLARATDQDISIGEADLAAAAQVCRRLDGVPLAIELAAARLRTRTLPELLEELTQAPHALARRRFRGRASHRSVAELVSWSSDLLDASNQGLFFRLGVFAGPFTADLAHDVAGDDESGPESTRRALDELVSASLVVADRSGAVTWYRLLHPVRAVAVEELAATGELQGLQSRLVDGVLARAVQVAQRAATEWEAAVLSSLLELYDNLTASVRWCLDNDEQADRALLLVAVLWGVVHNAHSSEVRALGDQVLARWPAPGAPMWPDAVATVATCRYLAGDARSAIELAERALPQAEQSLFAPASLRRVLAQAHRSLGEMERAGRVFGEAAEAAEASGVHGLAMEMWVAQGLVLAETGRIDEGLELIDRTLEKATRRGALINRAWALAGQAAAVLRRSAREALPLIETALGEAEAIGYPAGRAVGLRSLAAARLALDDVAGAAQALLDLLDELLQRGGLDELRLVVDVAAAVLEQAGHDRWIDLAATAGHLPVTSLATSVEPIGADRAGSPGTVLSIRDAYVLCRRELGALAAPPGSKAASHPGVEAARETVAELAVRSEMVLEGDVWRIRWCGVTMRLKRSKGLDDLARLLAAPGREWSSLDLMGSVVAGTAAEDELLDVEARRSYEARVRELQAEIDQADADNDLGRLEGLQSELDAVVDQLTAALGLGGRSRRTTGDGERARSAVTQRIRSAVKRIESVHAPLGAHLRTSVVTGTFCSYAPEALEEWRVDGI